jgi:spermidine/putrescine transport system ATP-binding protein
MSDRIAVMDHGHILQIGTPTEIYEHPTSRFVADFIGESNFLAAQLVDLGPAGARIRLEGGAELSARPPVAGNGADKQPGSAVTVAVRPERVALVPLADNAPLTATVENIVYFGTDTTFHLQLAGRDFVVRVQNAKGARQPFAVGETVGLRLAADALQVLRD